MSKYDIGTLAEKMQGVVPNWIDMLIAKKTRANLEEYPPIWEMSTDDLGLTGHEQPSFSFTRDDGSKYRIWRDPEMILKWKEKFTMVGFISFFNAGSLLYVPVKGGICTFSKLSIGYEFILTNLNVQKWLGFTTTTAVKEYPDCYQARKKCTDIAFASSLDHCQIISILTIIMEDVFRSPFTTDRITNTAKLVEFMSGQVNKNQVNRLISPVAKDEAGVNDSTVLRPYDGPRTVLRVDKGKGKLSSSDSSILGHPSYDLPASMRVTNYADYQVEKIYQPEESVHIPLPPKPKNIEKKHILEKIFRILLKKEGEFTRATVHQMWYGPVITHKFLLKKSYDITFPGSAVLTIIGHGACDINLIKECNKIIERCYDVQDVGVAYILQPLADPAEAVKRCGGAVRLIGQDIVLTDEEFKFIGMNLDPGVRSMYSTALEDAFVLKEAIGYGMLVITGISGAGKSTLGYQLATKMGWKFVDLDAFFRRDRMPKIHINGEPYFNYDCREAIDWKAFKNAVLKCNQGVVVTGYTLRASDLPDWPRLWIDLRYPGEEDQPDVNLIAVNRAKSKGFGPEKLSRDLEYIHKYVVPFYLEEAPWRKINYYLPVYRGSVRVPEQFLMGRILAVVVAYFGLNAGFRSVNDPVACTTPFFGTSMLSVGYYPFGEETFSPWGEASSFDLSDLPCVSFSKKKKKKLWVRDPVTVSLSLVVQQEFQNEP